MPRDLGMNTGTDTYNNNNNNNNNNTKPLNPTPTTTEDRIFPSALLPCNSYAEEKTNDIGKCVRPLRLLNISTANKLP